MSELSRLGGIGPKRLEALTEAGIKTLRDLIYHLPRRYVDRTKITPIASLKDGDEAFFAGNIETVSVLPNRIIVGIDDGTGSLDLVFFRGLQFLKSRFKIGKRLSIAGAVTFFRNLQIAHPEWEDLADSQQPNGGILPVYPLTETMEESRVDHKLLQRVALEALKQFQFTDPISEQDRFELKLKPEIELLRILHAPVKVFEIDEATLELKTRELWPVCQKMEGIRRERLGKGKRISRNSILLQSMVTELSFTLTDGQKQVLEELLNALDKPQEFHGLLQGDVGSGKTAVALLAAANVISHGSQVALLAPTEILAEQHFRTASTWLGKQGFETALLTASVNLENRETILERLKLGEIHFLIGTHALLSSDVIFHDLRFIIMDEQHRFGVTQRAAMAAKGHESHVLFLSATPIPRSLAQAWFGDLQLLTLQEKPPGRLPIKTRMVPTEKELDLLSFLKKETESNNQVYWVVPRIDGDDQKLGGDAAIENALKRLKKFKPLWQIAAIHGRLNALETERILTQFRQGEIKVLVATTVIEVGVDIPGANIMVVEGADRFGMAQLHQLRGRTGRGKEQAWCFLLVPKGGWTEEITQRLRAFCDEDDGFKIAELDLQRRGAGNLVGKEQSGFGALRFANPLDDSTLILELMKKAAL